MVSVEEMFMSTLLENNERTNDDIELHTHDNSDYSGAELRHDCSHCNINNVLLLIKTKLKSLVMESQSKYNSRSIDSVMSRMIEWINNCDSKGRSALHRICAIHNKNKSKDCCIIIHELIQFGAEIHKRNR